MITPGQQVLACYQETRSEAGPMRNVLYSTVQQNHETAQILQTVALRRNTALDTLPRGHPPRPPSRAVEHTTRDEQISGVFGKTHTPPLLFIALPATCHLVLIQTAPFCTSMSAATADATPQSLCPPRESSCSTPGPQRARGSQPAPLRASLLHPNSQSFSRCSV